MLGDCLFFITKATVIIGIFGLHNTSHHILSCLSLTLPPPFSVPIHVSLSDKKQMNIGDEHPLTLDVVAENLGEGAYEAELHVYIPPQADFIGTVRKEVWPDH